MSLLIQELIVIGFLFAAAGYLGLFCYRQFTSRSSCAACKLKEAALKKPRPAGNSSGNP